jgi:hypothetical protein
VPWSLALCAPGLAAASWTIERGRGSLDLLRGTPLGAHAIVGGKLRATAYRAIDVFSLGGFAFALGCPCILALEDGRVFFLSFFPAALASGFVAATAGLLAGTLVRSTVSALVLAYSLALASLVAGPLLLGSFLPGFPFGPLLEISRIFPEFPREDRLARLSLSIAGGLLLGLLQWGAAVLVFRWRWMRDR